MIENTLAGSSTQHSHIFLGEQHAQSERKTWIVIWRCGAMMLAEIAGGLLFGSIALVADGMHMSTHAGALLLAALAYTYARKHCDDPRFTFGTGKLGDLAGFAHLDPGSVIWGKATLGALGSFLIAWISGQVSVPPSIAAEIFVIGAIGYGLSLRFYLFAQRSFGSARTGSVFAAAPFVGALIAFALGERGFTWWLAAGAALMASGVVLHMLEDHEHQHGHDDLEHEHAHTHDDGHHSHRHSPMPMGAHSHGHRHRPVRHAHPHAPDLHHLHTH